MLRAVGSALAQRVPRLEILVVDNASTDDTWRKLTAVADDRVRLVRNNRNMGLFGNFNRCLDLSRGKYLRFLCSDDVLTPGCLTNEIAALEALPGAVLLSSRGRFVDRNGAVLGVQGANFRSGIYPGRDAIPGILWLKAHYGYNPLNFPSGVLLRREAAVQSGRFDANLKMSGDVDFFLRVLQTGDLLVSEEVGCEIAVHADQESNRLAGSISIMEEEYMLLERFRDTIEPHEMYATLVRQLSGVCLGLAQKLFRAGDPDGARRHLALARSHGSNGWQMSIALARIAALRGLLKGVGIRIRPPQLR